MTKLFPANMQEADRAEADMLCALFTVRVAIEADTSIHNLPTNKVLGHRTSRHCFF
jgi:hypothetical protein